MAQKLICTRSLLSVLGQACTYERNQLGAVVTLQMVEFGLLVLDLVVDGTPCDAREGVGSGRHKVEGRHTYRPNVNLLVVLLLLASD